MSSTPFGTVASTRPRSSVSNPPALAATAAAVSSAASSRMARTASSSGLSFCVSTSAVRVGSSSARGGAGSSRALRAKNLSRLRGAAFAGARGLEPSPFGSRSALVSVFVSVFVVVAAPKNFAMPPFAEGVVAKSDAASPTRVHGIVACPCASNTAMAASAMASAASLVASTDSPRSASATAMASVASLVSSRSPPVFSVKKVVADRATAFAARLGNPKLLLRISVSCPTRPAFQSRRCVVLSWARYSSLSSFGARRDRSRSSTSLSASSRESTRSHRCTRGLSVTAANDLNAHRLFAPSRTFGTTGSMSSPTETRASQSAVFASNSRRKTSDGTRPNADARNPPSYDDPRPAPLAAVRAASDTPPCSTTTRSTRSPNFPPSPRTDRIGSESSISGAAARDTTVCLLGLFLADANLANILLCATPPLIVNPVSANTAARARRHTSAPIANRRSSALASGSRGATAPLASTPSRTRAAISSGSPRSTASTSAVTSRYASSMDARSTVAHSSASVDMIFHDARRYRCRDTFRDERSGAAATAGAASAVSSSTVGSPVPPPPPPTSLSSSRSTSSSSPMVSTCTSAMVGQRRLASAAVWCRRMPASRAG